MSGYNLEEARAAELNAERAAMGNAGAAGVHAERAAAPLSTEELRAKRLAALEHRSGQQPRGPGAAGPGPGAAGPVGWQNKEWASPPPNSPLWAVERPHAMAVAAEWEAAGNEMRRAADPEVMEARAAASRKAMRNAGYKYVESRWPGQAAARREAAAAAAEDEYAGGRRLSRRRSTRRRSTRRRATCRRY